MRTTSALLLFPLGAVLAAPAYAQTPAAPLPIPLPPGAAVQMEMDGKDTDLLGLVKGLLVGAAAPKTGTADVGAGGNPFLALLGDGQLTALLKDIHHLHVVSFKTPAAVAVTIGANTISVAPTDYLAFYEKPFEAEGGHRLLYVTQGAQVVMVGFDQPRGFAAAVQSGATVTVVRADGYPDMAVLGNLLRTFGAAVPSLTLPTAPPVPATPAPPAPKPTPKTTRAKARKA